MMVMDERLPVMPDILLATINARYTHASLGLRWLWANLGPLRERAAIREFIINQPPAQIAEALLAENPRLIGFGVYIWNVLQTTEVIQTIKAVRPEITIVIGGPEVSYEYEGAEIFELADALIRGEADLAFADLARDLLAGKRPAEKVITPPSPDLAALMQPYEAYTGEDIARRRLYVEASRGCPFRCEFCLSSLDETVREFPLAPFLAAMDDLVEGGARQLKFVDRTFNLKPARVWAILHHFLGRWRDRLGDPSNGLQLHFEIVPDRLSPDLLGAMAAFPPGALHLEVGVQTFNHEVQAAISRRQDLDRTEATLRFLRDQTGALLHADLIAGLPGESWESFSAGFDRLLALRPHAIQVGVLKRLRGAPIARHTKPHTMVYAARPPYEILQNDQLDFTQLQRLKRFARYFDLYYNAGNFNESLDLLWSARVSAFASFMALSDQIWSRTGRTHELPLLRLAHLLYDFLVEEYQAGRIGADPEVIAATLERDYHRLPGRREKLELGKDTDGNTTP